MGMCFSSLETRIVLIGVDDIKNDWQKAAYGSHVEEMDEKR